MSDTIESLRESVTKLEGALKRQREEAKADRLKATEAAAFRKAVATSLGMDAGAADSEVFAALARPADDKVAAAVKERDAAQGRVTILESERDKLRQDWDSERIDRALRTALRESNALAEFDDLAIEKAKAGGRFVVGEDGKVTTGKDSPAGAGLEPGQYVAGFLKNEIPSCWPRSIGGGARGGTGMQPAFDPAIFDRASPKFSLTAIGAAYKADPASARREAARHGINLP